MGGMGSGRYPHYKTVEQFRSIDVRRWNREKLLDSAQDFNWRWYADDGSTRFFINVYVDSFEVTLEYPYITDNGSRRKNSDHIKLDWTACAYGGHRPWFLCPVENCERRVAVLYIADRFACRHCLGLTYPSQRESTFDRALRRAETIRDRLEWGWQPFFSHGRKPLGMHWERYQRITDLHDELIEVYRSEPIPL